jgi:hypothetical protein
LQTNSQRIRPLGTEEIAFPFVVLAAALGSQAFARFSPLPPLLLASPISDLLSPQSAPFMQRINDQQLLDRFQQTGELEFADRLLERYAPMLLAVSACRAWLAQAAVNGDTLGSRIALQSLASVLAQLPTDHAVGGGLRSELNSASQQTCDQLVQKNRRWRIWHPINSSSKQCHEQEQHGLRLAALSRAIAALQDDFDFRIYQRLELKSECLTALGRELRLRRGELILKKRAGKAKLEAQLKRELSDAALHF